MHWSRIKTLFIFSFLLLNIYLLVQFFEKQEQADLSVLDQEETTIEDRLKAENIEINVELPDEQSKEPFISVRQKAFTEDEFQMFDAFKNQQAVLIDKTFIVSLFKKPVAIPVNESPEAIGEVVKESMAFPEEYVFWDWNEEMNVLLFFQEKNERPIYFNQNGLILVFLNDKNEMTFYTQTMLGDSDSSPDKKSLIKPFKAIETLYNANELHSGDEITTVDMGFHTRVPLPNGVQVFVPTWKVEINDEKDYFVNAIEGFVFSSDDLEFIKETVRLDMEKIQTSLGDQHERKDYILTLFKEKLAQINGGKKE